jgi:hypothetical protein
MRLIPSETELQPPLPTIVGNVDYHDFRATLLRMDELLLTSGAEEQWMRRSLVHRLEHAAPRAQHHAEYQRIVETHSRRALRCNLARVLLKEGLLNVFDGPDILRHSAAKPRQGRPVYSLCGDRGRKLRQERHVRA